MRAAQMEVATARGRQRGGRFAVDCLEADDLAVREHQLGHAVKQCPRIGMQGICVGGFAVDFSDEID